VCIAQRGSNHHNQFLTWVEYDDGGLRSFIIIPEGREGKGWKSCALELQKVLAFFETYVNARCSSSRVFHSGVQMFSMGGSVSMVEKKNSTRVVSSTSYAEALVRPGPVPSSATRRKGNYGILDGSRIGFEC
jgi:hypothetical protein